MKIKALGALALVVLLSAFGLSQNLTVAEIMAEPSIAGTRVENERLSPDGTKVIFLWNAEGKLPRDLYIVPTDGSAKPSILLRLSDFPPPPPRTQTENKLDYGLTVRDDFVKARENAIGGFDWSPDSKKILFSQGGDLYVLTLGESEPPDRYWTDLESNLIRRADLIPKLVAEAKSSGIQELDLFGTLAETRAHLLRAIGTVGKKPKAGRDEVFAANASLEASLSIFRGLAEKYPKFRSSSEYQSLMDELNGTENRISVAKSDIDTVSKSIKRYTKTQSGEVAARFVDNDRILYQQNGNIFVLNTKDATTVQLTKDADPAKFIGVGNATVSKDGSMLAYVVSDSSKQRALVVPNYLGEFTDGPTFRRGWSEQKVFVTPADASRDTPFEIKLAKPEGVSFIRRMVWAADNRSLIVDRVDKDTKRRQLFYIHNAGSKDEQIITIADETDDKWQASLSSIFEPNPKDAKQLFFGSEKDGFNHLYLATLETETRPVGSVPTSGERVQEGGETLKKDVKVTQLTKGNWQVEWAKWNQTGDQIIYLSTEKGTSTRTFSSITIEGRKVAAFQDTANTEPAGMIESPQIATETTSPIPQVIYGFSTWNRPVELVGQKICFACSASESMSDPVTLTRTTPDSFAQRKWNIPKFIDIPSRDGKQIKSKIYLPAGHDAKKKYPMVIFVHGAGYLQNTINGWNNYYREFMFNELLTQKGYVVLDIDYRGSAGYGRDWRTDVYDFLGGKDYDDHIDAIDFMIKNYGVDAKRVGVYGGSYGGFIAEMLAFRNPEKIAAAAALRPVADWKNYYASSPVYTAQRLGFPDKNPAAYKRSSPISYADGLKTQLLILHGMSDDNVHVQDSVQLIEKLIRLNKTEYFQAMLYPSENHGFVRPESWTDEYSRILAFFEKNLK